MDMLLDMDLRLLVTSVVAGVSTLLAFLFFARFFGLLDRHAGSDNPSAAFIDMLGCGGVGCCGVLAMLFAVIAFSNTFVVVLEPLQEEGKARSAALWILPAVAAPVLYYRLLGKSRAERDPVAIGLTLWLGVCGWLVYLLHDPTEKTMPLAITTGIILLGGHAIAWLFYKART